MNRMLSALIVDDERYIREGLRNLLEWENIGFFICDEAGSGQEALERSGGLRRFESYVCHTQYAS